MLIIYKTMNVSIAYDEPGRHTVCNGTIYQSWQCRLHTDQFHQTHKAGPNNVINKNKIKFPKARIINLHYYLQHMEVKFASGRWIY